MKKLLFLFLILLSVSVFAQTSMVVTNQGNSSIPAVITGVPRVSSSDLLLTNNLWLGLNNFSNIVYGTDFCLMNGTCLSSGGGGGGGNGSFVPYTGATSDVDLNNKSLVNVYSINTTEIYVSNNSLWVGGVHVYSNNVGQLEIAGNVTGNFFVGSGKYLTDVNSSNNSIFSNSSEFSNTSYFANTSATATFANSSDTANTADFATSTVDHWVNSTGDNVTGNISMTNNSLNDVDTIIANTVWSHYYGGRSPITFISNDGSTLVNFTIDNTSNSGAFGVIRAHQIIVDNITVGDFINWSDAGHPVFLSNAQWVNESKYMYINETMPQAINTTVLCYNNGNCSMNQTVTHNDTGVYITWT